MRGFTFTKEDHARIVAEFSIMVGAILFAIGYTTLIKQSQPSFGIASGLLFFVYGWWVKTELKKGITKRTTWAGIITFPLIIVILAPFLAMGLDMFLGILGT